MSYKECMKSELDLFSNSLIQSNILKTEEVAYKPIASLDNSTVLEFISLGHGDTYRDLSSIYLRLKVQLIKLKDGKEELYEKGGTPVGLVNNVMHSLFRQCTIQLNGKPIAQTDHNYQYRAYIENLLNYGSNTAKTHLESVGWYLDENEMDIIENGKPEDSNSGYIKRSKLLAGSSVVEFMGKVHGDILNQDKLLINGVDLRVIFSLEKPEFYLYSKEDSNSPRIKIIEATMYMNHVTISPSILLAHENVLQRSNAIYPYKRVEVKTYTLPANTFSLSLDNVVIGQLPNLIVFGMVDNDAYTGKRTKNSYNFKHNNLVRFNLSVNGVQIPNQPLEFDFSDEKPISTRGYLTLFKGTGIHYSDRGHQISKQFFDNGAFLLAFDLTPDNSYNTTCGSLLNQGTIRIEGRFRDSLKKSVTCIVYAEYDGSIEVDKARNVYTSF
ncbi:uncharacterized protein F54H12.2-like [Hermetia illucens]|uniref:uncharacterized protein F54H12.2-like n=1 Tax=Hermetia illucens TaxID=343691 RepID=UPI0018CC01CA|nr:uncharacterized protein F54H12.2-like [Hermetia illucens]